MLDCGQSCSSDLVVFLDQIFFKSSHLPYPTPARDLSGCCSIYVRFLSSFIDYLLNWEALNTWFDVLVRATPGGVYELEYIYPEVEKELTLVKELTTIYLGE